VYLKRELKSVDFVQAFFFILTDTFSYSLFLFTFFSLRSFLVVVSYSLFLFTFFSVRSFLVVVMVLLLLIINEG